MFAQLLSMSGQVWCADQRQAGFFATAAGSLQTFLVETKTENVWNVLWPINFTKRRWFFKIPTTAGGQDYTQQTTIQAGRPELLEEHRLGLGMHPSGGREE